MTRATSNSSQHEIQRVLDRLLQTLLWLAATLGLVALAGSWIRWTEQGWHARYAVHIAVYVVILATLVAGRRLSRLARSVIVIGSIAVDGLAKLYWDGLRGNGGLVLAVACILACTLIGRRAAMVGVIASLGAIALVGLGYTTGALALPSNVGATRRSPAEWFGFAATFAVFTFAALLSVDGIQQALLGLLARLHERTALLRDSEQHYRLLAENMQDVVFILDSKLNVTYVSPSVQKVSGYDPDELTGVTLSHLFAPESCASAMQRVTEGRELMERGDPGIPLAEFEYAKKDGSRFWGEVRVSAIRNEDGTLAHFHGVLRDVTDRKRAEAERERLRERLLETERLNALGQLAGGVAHDFNNQLAGIIGFADMIAVSESPSQMRADAKSIATAARRAADSTGQLLAFARKGRAREEPVDVHRLIGEIVAVLERSIDRNVRIRRELVAHEAVVLGDSSTLQNALLNIALNARDAMPAGGELTFATSVQGGSEHGETTNRERLLVLRVTDTGAGMDSETQKHIFEPFFTTKEPGRGTGMGLAAVYGTVQSHGGSIEVASAPGQGTTFTMRLPLAARTRPAAEARGEPLVRGQGQLLVIDDEPLVRQMTCSALDVLGYQVMSCGNAEEALALFERTWQNVDLVLLDMVLPGVRGTQLFDALRRIDPTARVLFMSGYSDQGNTASLVELGAAGFLQKPFRLAELSDKVARIVGAVKTD
jgi:PAS domain S-box-containing protein